MEPGAQTISWRVSTLTRNSESSVDAIDSMSFVQNVKNGTGSPDYKLSCVSVRHALSESSVDAIDSVQ